MTRLLASARAGKFVSKRGNCETDAGLAGGPRPLGLRGGGLGQDLVGLKILYLLQTISLLNSLFFYINLTSKLY